MPRPPKYALEPFFTSRRLLPSLAFAPDGEAVAFSADFTGTFNLYRVDVAGGAPVQLTESKQLRPLDMLWAPDNYIYFLADVDGDERCAVYRIRAEGGPMERLTDRPDVQYISLGLSFDGGALYYAGNAINPSENHLFRRDLRTGEERLIGGGLGLWAPGYESSNGRYLTIAQELSNSDTRVHLWDHQTGELRELTAGQPAARRLPGPWSEDKYFIFLSDETGEFTQGYAHILEGASIVPYITPKWDVDALLGSRESSTYGFIVNENGYSRIVIANDEADMLCLAPEALQGGVIHRAILSPDGTKVALLLNQPSRPADLMLWELASGAVTRLTTCLGGVLDPADMVSPERISIPGPDHPIPAWLYRPVGLEPGEQVPVLLAFHGGPEAQELPIWTASYQYLLDRGIAILAPNIRGSTGYGKSYQRQVQRDWGGGDLRDMEACAQWAQAQPWVKPGKLAVFGGSYGGFAALSCATRLPDYWACAVDLWGPANLVTLTASVPPTWRPMMKGSIGDPEEDREFLLERSPITYVDQLRCPLLVVQGARDPRVVQAESDQMVAALQARGIAVEYLLFPDEGHGLAKQVNREKALKVIAEFLQKHLS